ncbi:SufE family protein [Candidatus Foliamicus sp.]
MSIDQPSHASLRDAQEEVLEELEFFDSWMERYQHIIEMGRNAPEFPDEWRIEDNRLHGCQSQVWLKSWQEGGRLFFRAVSDSAIVSGLAAILMRVYSGRPPREIAEARPEFIAGAGLDRHLSPTRSNGLHSMVDQIRGLALKCL